MIFTVGNSDEEMIHVQSDRQYASISQPWNLICMSIGKEFHWITLQYLFSASQTT